MVRVQKFLGFNSNSFRGPGLVLFEAPEKRSLQVGRVEKSLSFPQNKNTFPTRSQPNQKDGA